MRYSVTLISFAIMLGYIAFGGALFYYLESDQEAKTRTLLKELQTNLTLKNATCVSIEDLKYYISVMLNASKAGVLESNSHATSWQWDYAGSLFFSLTTISTIGYGYLAPATTYGKIASIFYALFGIPIFLNALGQLSMVTKNRMLKIGLSFNKICRSHHIYKHTVLLLFVICFYISAFILPSIYIAQMENWSLSDSFYYSFITISTIGFGDFVAGNQQNSSRWYKFFISVWMLYGLVYMAIFISYIQLILEKVLNFFEKRRRVEPNVNKTERTNVTMLT